MLRFAASLSFEAIRGEPFRGPVLITTTCQRSVLCQSQVHSHATPHRRCTGLIRSQNLDIKRACAALHQDHLALHVLVMHGAASIQWLRPHHGAVRKLVVHIVTQTRQAIPERRVPGRTQSNQVECRSRGRSPIAYLHWTQLGTNTDWRCAWSVDGVRNEQGESVKCPPLVKKRALRRHAGGCQNTYQEGTPNNSRAGCQATKPVDPTEPKQRASKAPNPTSALSPARKQYLR
jgi:hypothetical protein